MGFLERIFINVWNRRFDQHAKRRSGTRLGLRVIDEQPSKQWIFLGHEKRCEHIAILGKTGSGKTSLIKYLIRQDVESGRGFLCVDLHGELTPFVLTEIAHKQRMTTQDLSSRLIVVDPADPERAVGMNLLELSGKNNAMQISETVELLRKYWHLDRFGARTEELLRNALWAISENGLTLLEVAPLLTDRDFRAALIAKLKNPEVRGFFEERYNVASGPLQTVMREAILNKVSAFALDASLRHIVGQRDSSIDLTRAIDGGKWIVVSLNKGALGENAIIFAGLLLTRIKNAVFARRTRSIYSIYADELQNLVASTEGLDTLISEARKQAISLVIANQHLQQLSLQMRASVLSVGTNIFFRLSPEDAPQISKALDGGSALETILKSLPQRHFVMTSDEKRWVEALVAEVTNLQVSYADLLSRSNEHWARPREQIEADIQNRRPKPEELQAENFEGWE